LVIPRRHDLVLLEQQLAAELHLRDMRRVVPVYIGRSKSDGSSIHPASQPPQVSFSTTDSEIV
jgi:hypothetical protein